MKLGTSRTRRTDEKEAGAALLIAIFALLLISVVAIALVVSVGTDSALAGNYRTSTTAYYAALAGLEEARGRLLANNPDYINKSMAYSALFTAQGVPSFGPTDVFYIINPAGGETVAPTDMSNPATYPDIEYQTEFGGPPPTSATIINSVSPVAGFPGQPFKWVRINAVAERSLNIDVDGDGDATSPSLLYFDSGKPRPSLIVPPLTGAPATALQALEITSLAVLPSGSRRMLQYVVAPNVVSTANSPSSSPPSPPPPPNLDFPAALTVVGNNVNFTGPATNSFSINGLDQISTPWCTGTNSLVASIGYTNSADGSFSNIVAGATPAKYYLGYPPEDGETSPPQPSQSPNSVLDVSHSLRPNLLTPSGLDALVQDITKSADIVISGNATASSLPASMSASSPMTVVVNGDLNLDAWHGVGYGLLLVTGTLYYDPDATWEGIVLVIGQGNFVSTKNGTGGIDGAVLIAKTRDLAGNLLTTLGSSSFNQTGSGNNLGRGINYSSCFIKTAQGVAPGSSKPGAQGPLTYKVLSFREIPLN